MTNEMKTEAKVFYDNLDESNKQNVKFKIYTECKSMDNKEKCMIWLNTSRIQFIKEFTY